MRAGVSSPSTSYASSTSRTVIHSVIDGTVLRDLRSEVVENPAQRVERGDNAELADLFTVTGQT